MPTYRLSGAAQVDIASILRASEGSHGKAARIRYRGLLAAATLQVAQEPEGAPTRDRGELAAGLRSMHIRHAGKLSREARVAAPVHVIFSRAVSPDLVEIVRVLHERMEPGLHVGPD